MYGGERLERRLITGWNFGKIFFPVEVFAFGLFFCVCGKDIFLERKGIMRNYFCMLKCRVELTDNVCYFTSSFF